MHDCELYQTILGLTSPWRVTAVELKKPEKQVVVTVGRPTEPGVECPQCGQTVSVYDHLERRWRHLDTCQYQTLLAARVPRANCPEHGVHQVAVPWAEGRAQFTALFEGLVVDWLQAASLSGVAAQFGLSWDEAFGIQQRAVNRGMARRKAAPLEYAGVDEKAFKKGHKYLTLLCDIRRRVVRDVAEDRRFESLQRLLRQLTPEEKQNLKGVAMDMWAPYLKAVDAELPLGRAKVVFDKFHVVQHLNKGVDQVRRREAKELAAEDDERLKGSKYQWLKNPKNFTRIQWREFKALRESNLKVAKAWAMKETIKPLWDFQYVGAAKRLFKKWYGWVKRSRLKPMIAKAELMKTHLDNILTYLKHPITNAVAESINAKIQWIKYTARGYANMENFRTAILFHCGGLDLSPRTHTKA